MRLLNKTIRSYLFFSFIILLLTIPLFYFIIKRIVLNDADKNLIAQKEEMVRKLDRAVLFDPFDLLGALEPDINLMPSRTIRLFDTLYTARIYSPTTHQVTPYRILTSNVIIRGQYYEIQLKNSLVSNEDLIQSIVLVQAILLVLIGGGLVLINRKLSKQIWNPFYNTLSKLQHYKIEQEGSIHFPETEVEEFNDLNTTIENLTERNYNVFLSQKEFTENASHELQTPLAVLQTKLELLMQTQPLTEEQASLISDLNNANSRLSRLNKSLLLLTKIDNNQYPETEDVNVAEVCKKVLEQLSYQAEVKKILVQTNLQSNCTIHVNKALFEILVSNLLSNAIRYNYEGGNIQIAVEKNTLTLQNTSQHSMLKKEKVFERFHKEGNHPQSIGLGLAIVKRICALYSFTIDYSYNDDLHIFTLNLSPMVH